MSDKPIDKASEEIKAIIKKYDLAAQIVLIDQDTTNFVNDVSPTWSCAQWDEETDELRIKAKREHYATKEEHEKIVTDTISMVMALFLQAKRNAENFAFLVEKIGENFDVTHAEKRRY